MICLGIHTRSFQPGYVFKCIICKYDSVADVIPCRVCEDCCEKLKLCNVCGSELEEEEEDDGRGNDE